MQIISSCSTNPGFNLAAEEYLFSQSQDEILFLYVNTPCVVIGCNQALYSEVDTDYCSTHSISVFRRLSGGGAVYHDEGNLNYCFIKNRIPGKFPLGDEFLKPVMAVLEKMSITVQMGVRKDLWLPGGFKISGTASHVGKDRELHHGTLLYDSDLEKLQLSLSPKPTLNKSRAIASVSSPVKNIRTYLSEINCKSSDSQIFYAHLFKQLLEYYNLSSVQYLTEDEVCKIRKIQASVYECNDWTFKK